ncbi:YkyA family protein [Aquibacillus sp. 3ASR75-11]|uniref:YkyA family protein n=1 Tax=Terrihalobacillus insolitus TaxID=2950438 RepID=A0A9X3WTS2_9BACI|nr:YkyA family protein [Terrihalobacillus insolitus]MDC3412772.1 YkyA family protein [Terrihalobacillus insolitus]MDC3423751.1 YkyA family protein [Terrihalobacillus insolitus]
MLFKKLFTIIFFVLLLSACNDTSTAEKMYNHLEETVALEKDFQEQQEPLVQLEEQEKELYTQIISLGIEELERVKKLSKKALNSIDNREDRMKIEKESIIAAQKEFEKIEPLIEELESEKAKEEANTLYKIMSERYEAYFKLNKAYIDSLSLDRTLYELLQKEDLTEKELSEQIDKINKSYGNVISANQTFNEKTKAYNKLKEEFYQLVELDVQYKGESGDVNQKD